MATSTARMMQLFRRRPRAAAPIVVRTATVPARGRGRAFLRKVGGVARAAAVREKTMLRALAGAAALGGVKRLGVDLPKIDMLGISGTYGLVLYGVGRFMNSQLLQDASIGPLSVALFNLVGAGAEGLTTSGERRVVSGRV